MKRILLLGKDGQLGWELSRMLAQLGELSAMGRGEADLAKPNNLRDLVRSYQPNLIVNAAAYTNVDRAEAEPHLAMAVNADSPGVLAEEASRLGALMMHFSTDYVYDGTRSSPYVETDSPNPVNTYGRSKLAGDHAVENAGGPYLIFRTSWVYSMRRDNFVTKILRWAEDRDRLRIVDDRRGSPTWSRTLADATVHALADLDDASKTSMHGLFHVACRGAPSRYELARMVLAELGLDSDIVIEPAQSTDFGLPAKRPSFSALNPSRFEETFRYQMPSWEECVRAALASGTS